MRLQTVSNEKIIDLVSKGKAILVCSEHMGGLPTPRTPSEIKDGKVIQKDGTDVTANFFRDAQEYLKIAKLYGCKNAILKSKSHSY